MTLPSPPWGSRHVAHTQEDPSRGCIYHNSNRGSDCGEVTNLLRAAPTWTAPPPTPCCPPELAERPMAWSEPSWFPASQASLVRDQNLGEEMVMCLDGTKPFSTRSHPH